MAMAYLKAIFFLGIASLLMACACAQDFSDFGYSGANGPDKWGSLSSEFQLCSQGKSQSPIDIIKNQTVYDPNLQSPTRDYVPTTATLINNGVDIELRYDKSAGKVMVDGKNYSLLEMHWLSPSEHTIDEQRFQAELQLFHKGDDGNMVVVAILYQYGHPDAFLLQIKDDLAKLAKEKCAADQMAQIPVGTVQTRSLKRRTRKYFKYVGSLTTPPCTENVTWIILGKIREMTQEQASTLINPLKGEYQKNSRPIQPMNGRTVKLYDESQRAQKSN